MEALKGEKTSTKLASIYGGHPGQIRNWKNIAKDGLIEVFKGRINGRDKEKDRLIEELYKQIGQFKSGIRLA